MVKEKAVLREIIKASDKIITAADELISSTTASSETLRGFNNEVQQVMN
jgi:hypothetical protein